ncbi:MAG: hypothetical protein SO151_04465 [Collinsella sp.]|nr:hypothetical protein [Collinsella sp.]
MSGIIEAEKLKAEPTRDLMREAFEVGGVLQEGTAVTRVMPPGSRFGAKAEARDRQRHAWPTCCRGSTESTAD